MYKIILFILSITILAGCTMSRDPEVSSTGGRSGPPPESSMSGADF